MEHEEDILIVAVIDERPDGTVEEHLFDPPLFISPEYFDESYFVFYRNGTPGTVPRD